jgi:hypothetical protein
MKAVRLIAFVCLCLGLLIPPASAHDDQGGGSAAATTDGTHNLRLQSNSPPPTDLPGRPSDLAFSGNLAVVGSFDGFRILDIRNPNKPRTVSEFHCNGAQGDVSIHGDLVFRSVDTPQSSTDCDSTNVTADTPGHFEGVQVFDVSDPANPEHINSIYIDCGSHTHTLVPDGDRLFIYVASYPIGGASIGPNCQAIEHDPVDGGHSKISIIEVDLDDPSWDGDTTVFPYHLDDGTAFATYLGAFTLRACHDISVFTAIDRAAAACLSESQMWDISDPANPQFLWRYDNDAVQPANVDLWHSAAFTWDGEVVAFGDESGGGGAARCIDPDDDQGRIWFLDVETGDELASYKIPRSVPGICTMHNFNFIPQRHGNYTLVSSAYTGGTTVVDVNLLLDGHTEAESEIAWAQPEGDNAWSSYWYNGNIYANGNRGVDTFLLRDGARAREVRLPHSNPQTQERLIP